MRCVRIWFNKTGICRYISHLDLMRTMTRTIRRSKITLWYTEGFNPHPYLTFSLPLSLGMESVCESADIRIEGDATNDEIFSALKAVMPDAIELTAVTDPVMDAKSIALGDFEITFSGFDNADGFVSFVKSMLEADSLIVQKLGKKGHRKVYKDIDLMDSIKKFSLSANGEDVVLRIILPAGSVKNINPSLLCDEIVKRADCPISYVIRRKRLLTENGEVFC